ncbi:MAG: nuclear transport factor 2 family protein [Nitrososphaerota archaeon]|nr:nuclear transport factor 2 family protein [Nitrososphaerota archaeon]
MSVEKAQKDKVVSAIYAHFEAGKNKDLTALEGFHADETIFSKFDEFPPYSKQDLKQAILFEQAAFANMSDYQYKLHDLKVDFVYPVAVATFYLEYSAVFVNNYSFEGRQIKSKSRVTMVFAKREDDWKIIHEHFSTFSDWPTHHQHQNVGP